MHYYSAKIYGASDMFYLAPSMLCMKYAYYYSREVSYTYNIHPAKTIHYAGRR